LPIQVDEAVNGEEAIALYKKNQYDFLIMDMQMPVLDGYQATKEIKSMERENNLPKVPIVGFSACVLKEEINKVLNAGCFIYLAKPVRKADFISKIYEVIIRLECFEKQKKVS